MKNIARNVYQKSPKDFFTYFASYMLLSFEECQRLGVSVFSKGQDGIYYRQDVVIDEKTGKGEIGGLFESSGRDAAIIECMLKYVSK